MMREKRVRKSIRISILTGLMALMMAVTAFADPLDLEKTGSITINMRTGDDSSAQAIPGGEMAIYKAADVKAVGGTQDNPAGGYFFEVIAPFSGTEYDFEGRLNGKTSDQLNGAWSDLAEDMAAYAEAQAVTADETRSIGDDGRVVFDNLSAGLYLMVQTEPASGYSSVKPFLVSIPLYNEETDNYDYEVDTYPKTGPAEKREYYNIDEEIVTDTDDIWDRDAWIHDESVNEYEDIEIEMTTYLPMISGYDVAHGEITMNFHEMLDPELLLDEETADFEVYIGGHQISPTYYRIVFDDDTGDDCNFHVDVDLTALYNDGIVTDDMLLGDTEITVFFHVDLEAVDEKNHYASTIWYEIFDGYDEETRELLHTSNVVEVYVYTFGIEITKINSKTNALLKGATFAIYTDEECTEPFKRNGSDYTVTSGNDGMARFNGLAAGTYYVKETSAPSGYIRSDEVFEIILDDNMSGNIYSFSAGNTPSTTTTTTSNGGGGGYSGGGGGHSSTGGPGVDNTEEISDNGSDSSGSSVNTDSLGGIPQTGEGNTAMILIVVCVVLAILLAVLFYIRRKTSD